MNMLLPVSKHPYGCSSFSKQLGNTCTLRKSKSTLKLQFAIFLLIRKQRTQTKGNICIPTSKKHCLGLGIIELVRELQTVGILTLPDNDLIRLRRPNWGLLQQTVTCVILRGREKS